MHTAFCLDALKGRDSFEDTGVKRRSASMWRVKSMTEKWKFVLFGSD
jgi:hypothetical protein